MEFIRVVINGALGRMGKEVAKAVVREPGLKAVGAVDREVAQQYLPLAETLELVPFSSDLALVLKKCNADVVVDFTNAEASMAAARTAIKQRVNMVIGTSGLCEDDLCEIDQLCQTHGVGAIVAPDFSLGAALLIHLSKLAARFYDRAEIIETHNDRESGAPSATSIAAARAMAQMRGTPFTCPEAESGAPIDARGVNIDGVVIHSLRLPGFMAGHEVLFGGAGETLSISHNGTSVQCYLPGIMLAIKAVTNRKGLTCGLDALVQVQEGLWKGSA